MSLKELINTREKQSVYFSLNSGRPDMRIVIVVGRIFFELKN